MTEKQVLTLSCVSDLASCLWFKLWSVLPVLKSQRPTAPTRNPAWLRQELGELHLQMGDSEAPLALSKPPLGQRQWHSKEDSKYKTGRYTDKNFTHF